MALPSLSLTNGQTIFLVNWLSRMALAGKQSRIKTRFIKHVSERVKEYDDARLVLVSECSLKDEKGNAMKEDDGKKFKLDPEKTADFEAKFKELTDELFIFDGLESNKDMLETIARILIDTPEKIHPADAETYDQICTAFEPFISLP